MRHFFQITTPVLVILLLGCSDKVPHALAKPGTPVGIVTFAGDVTIWSEFGEDIEISDAVETSHEITSLMLLKLVGELKAKGVSVVPDVTPETILLDSSHLSDLGGNSKYVTGYSSIPLISQGARAQFAAASKALGASLLLWATNSYSWEVGGWTGHLPFAKSRWRFSIKTRLKVISASGEILWEDTLVSHSSEEWGEGRNYVLFSRSRITPQQANRLIESALSTNAFRLAGTIAALTGARQ